MENDDINMIGSHAIVKMIFLMKGAVSHNFCVFAICLALCVAKTQKLQVSEVPAQLLLAFTSIPMGSQKLAEFLALLPRIKH